MGLLFFAVVLVFFRTGLGILLPPLVNHPLQAVDRLGKRPQAVDESFLHSLFPIEYRANIHDQFFRIHRQIVEPLGRNPGMLCHKLGDPMLHPLEILKRLRYPQEQPVHPHRMDGHGSRGHDERPPRRYGQRHPDGMAASQHHGYCGFRHTGHQFCQGQAGFHIPADGVEQDEQSFDFRILFDGYQPGDHMLVLGCLVLAGQDVVPFNLAMMVRQWIDEWPSLVTTEPDS